ncbi:unnamed protein product [Malus baccata var. baccata]
MVQNNKGVNIRVQCNLGMPWVGFQALRAQTSLLSQSSQLGIVECNRMPKEVSPVARILKRHHENTAIKPCSNCGSPQGPVTLRTHWDTSDHEKFTTCNACRWHREVNIFCDILCSRDRH